MIHKETRKEQVVREREVVLGVTCDLCKCRFDGTSVTAEGINWSVADFHEQETIVRFNDTEYDGFAPGGTAKNIVFHICPDCFTKRLVPWLKEQGAEPTTAEFFF